MSELLVNEIVTLTPHVNKSDKDEQLHLKVANTERGNVLPEGTSTTKVDYDLSKFCLQRILNNNTRNKSIVLLGNFPDLSDSDHAIVIFEKQAFQECDVATNAYGQKKNEDNDKEQDLQGVKEIQVKPTTYFCSDLKVQTEFINDIYGSYHCTPPAKLNDVKATVVYPASDKHIEKYSISEKFVVTETPELYNNVTLPYINSSQFSIEWVYNILEHKQETERIIFEDPDPENGFILLPDLKCGDVHNAENLYVLVITHKRGIKSLRDLNESHLPLLYNIRTQAAKAIESHYNILSNQLRIYFHYQPSFYHLHIHINAIRNEAPGIWCEKSHLLDTVINNLELLPDYYKKATLPFVVYDGNKLLELYEEKFIVRRAIKKSTDLENESHSDKTIKPIIVEENTVEANDITMTE